MKHLTPIVAWLGLCIAVAALTALSVPVVR
jgi:hypothetical protein